MEETVNIEFPNWADTTPESVERDLTRLLNESEKAVAAIESAQPRIYEDLVWKLDDATRELWHCWSIVGHMLGVMNSDAWRKLEESFQPRIVSFALRVSQSKRIYDLAKEVLAKLPEESGVCVRRRILSHMILSAELAGVGLSGKARVRFNEIQAKLARLSADFANAVIDATTPEIADAAYIESMKHDPSAEKREALYRKRATRAPENAVRIKEILALRKECARLLGFPNYAEFSLATKCAPSPAAILKMIDELDAATATAAKSEDEELGVGLKPWDYAYVAERLRESKYAYSEEELKRHFEFKDVLKGLFRIAGFLFGVEFRELTGVEKPSVWEKSVRFFSVIEEGKTIAHFYLDAYARPGQKQGGAWMNEFRNRSVRPGRTARRPLALIVLNLKEPDEQGRSYLPMRDVETLFHEFGHALQCMLTRIDEEDAAGINLVEWDAVEVASQFMENWCLDDRTGISLPDDLKAKVRAAKNFRAASACRRQLAFAKTDLLLHLSDLPGDANAVKMQEFAHFGLPSIEDDRFLCSFTHIFAGGYAAGYYGYKWAEVMSADIYGAFEEAGLADDAAMIRLGRTYRETLLALGGSLNALEVFRRFRGRDPEIDALIRQNGLSSM